jgi:hypothetical protein
MKIHFYMLCFRTEALVASQLEPEAFGHYMATGTNKLTRGALMFFELERDKLNPVGRRASDAFRLHDIEQRCAAHADGRPKRSKYISIYRVLENLALDAIQRLHLVTLDGRVLPIDPRPADDGAPATEYLYQELAPVTPLICSTLSPTKFSGFMTDPAVPLYLPTLFFADLLLDREPTGEIAGYLPYENPAHLAACLQELKLSGKKSTKTVSRTPSIHSFFRTVNRGFYVGHKDKVLHFPFPTKRALEIDHARWWHSAQAG